MFSLHNIYTKANTTLRIAYGNKSVDFVIGTIINKRNKSELDNPNQFALIDAYLDYKGEAFKAKLMDLYEKAEREMLWGAIGNITNDLPTHLIHPILDHMDVNDVYLFVKEVFRLKPLSILKDTFDTRIEKDGYGTKAQTYIKDDYLQLAALTVTIKSVLGPISNYAYIKNDSIQANFKEYLLFDFITTHKTYECPAMVKLYGFVDTIVNMSLNSNKKEDKEAAQIRVITKLVPPDETTSYILSAVVLHKVSIATIVDDNDSEHIITRNYNYVNNKLTVHSDVPSTIRDKSIGRENDMGASSDQESRLETFRLATALPKGYEEELNWSVSNIDVIVNQLPIQINQDILNDAIKFTSVFTNGLIANEQIYILGIIFKDIIDPRALQYLRIENIINLLAVGFAYSWELKCQYIAVLLTSMPAYSNNDDVIQFNSTTNTNRIPKEIKEELQRYFPHQRNINDTTAVSVVEESINTISKELYSKRWLPTAYNNYIDKIDGGTSSFKALPSDLKIKLAEFIINLEKVRNVRS